MNGQQKDSRRKYDQSNPGLILFLLDQSSSMQQVVDGVPKSDIAAMAINKTIDSIVERCKRNGLIVDKAVVGVVGYGAETRYELIESVTTLNDSFKRMGVERESDGTEVEYKVWIEPRAENSTPMAAALALSADKLKEWVAAYPAAPPPVVINVTDGAPDDLQQGGDGKQTRDAATRLRGFDGKEDTCLLFSVHIGGGGAAVEFPSSRDQLRTKYEQLLFDISSVLPDDMLELGRKKGLKVSPGCRLMAFNASAPTLVSILDFGSTQRRRDDVD